MGGALGTVDRPAVLGERQQQTLLTAGAYHGGPATPVARANAWVWGTATTNDDGGNIGQAWW
jgi:hypothetical protein